MTAISKNDMNPNAAMPEEQARHLDLSDWSRVEGERIAAEEGIEMTPEHWKVVAFLRDYYRKHGLASSGRKLAQTLDVAFDQSGGNAHLHMLFPKGPVAQGSRIAGLPLPPYTEDNSFGSAM